MGGTPPSTPPLPSFLSAPGPLRLTFFFGGGGGSLPPLPSFLSVPGPPLRLTFFGGGEEGFKSQPYIYHESVLDDEGHIVIFSCSCVVLQGALDEMYFCQDFLSQKNQQDDNNA